MTQGTDWSKQTDDWLKREGPTALVCCQWLVPVEPGDDRIVFPPTFAGESPGKSKYNIDTLGNTRVALIDSVGSQANRMEPLFKEGEYAKLVPQIRIKAGDRVVHILDAGHRAADAIVRYSSMGSQLKEAFEKIGKDGDARALAKLAPTSLVFGAWDSRDTQVKLPRLLAATIRAWNVEPLTRSAQYNPPLDYADMGLLDNPEDKNVLDAASEVGFRHAPAAGTLGGVVVRGEIRREVVLSLVGLRALGPTGTEGDLLRRYVLGLALLAMVHERPHNLRQGCLLVREPSKKDEWKMVNADGSRPGFAPDEPRILEFTKDAAKKFGLDPDRDLKADKTYDFEKSTANAAIQEKVAGKSKKQAKRQAASASSPGGAEPPKKSKSRG